MGLGDQAKTLMDEERTLLAAESEAQRVHGGEGYEVSTPNTIRVRDEIPKEKMRILNKMLQGNMPESEWGPLYLSLSGDQQQQFANFLAQMKRGLP